MSTGVYDLWKGPTAGRIQIEHNMAVTLVANPPTLQEIKVKGWGLLHRFIQQLDAMESRHWVSFWHRASAGCYERDAQYLVLPALERVHSFWLTDHYGSDKQAQTSLNIVLDEYDKLAKACPYPPMTIVNTVMVKGLPNRYLRIYIYTIYHCVYV